MDHPDPVKSGIATAINSLFLDGSLDVTGISKNGHLEWAATDWGKDEAEIKDA